MINYFFVLATGFPVALAAGFFAAVFFGASFFSGVFFVTAIVAFNSIQYR